MSERSVSPNTLVEKLDEIVHTPLQKFDAFPKLPSTYKARSESRGFLTLFVTFMAFLLVLNDLGEYLWGWPDYEFSVDRTMSNALNINVDMIVNMGCGYLTVDLRDAVGDRLYLSDSFRRDGTLFDIGQATLLREHAAELSAREAISQSHKSRGFWATLFSRSNQGYRPTYNYQAAASACRIYGTVEVKKVTANLHITTLGHGYASHAHVPHEAMNLSHVINEFSFGPYFPDITQPLDNSFEITTDPFVSYQYYLNVVPTTYIAPSSEPLETAQYSVTHYTKVLEHGRGVPGIFFKFDLDPMSLTIYQRTTSLMHFLIRVVGVVGGVFVCMGYAVRITTHAVEAVTGADKEPVIAAEASGAGHRHWGSGSLHKRTVRQSGSGWADQSPYGSYSSSPVVNPYSLPGSPYMSGGQAYGLGLSSPTFPSPTPPTAATAGSPYTGNGSPVPSPYVPAAVAAQSPPSTAGLYAHFPPTPGGPGTPTNGPSAPPQNGARHGSNGSISAYAPKKDD